jgi:hypothetical protein
LLLEDGRRFRKHEGARAALNNEIIKPGRLDRKHGGLYNRLFRDRQEGDYVAFTKFDVPYVQAQLSTPSPPRGRGRFLSSLSPPRERAGVRGYDGPPALTAF